MHILEDLKTFHHFCFEHKQATIIIINVIIK